MTDEEFVINDGSEIYDEKLKTSTKEETDKKCDACGGTMDFDPTSGKLLCPFCGTYKEIVIKEAVASVAEADIDTAESTGNCDWGVKKKTVSCKSCGAHSVYDDLMISDVCPYCGSNQVMEEKGEFTLAPGGVCTFKLDKKVAGENFKKWIKSKIFCPSDAKKSAKPDSFKGVYMPYWTFDTFTESDYTARYGKNRTVRDSKGNTRTVTDWYSCSGFHSEFINDQAVLATDRHDPDIIRKIEPFDTESNYLYKPEYIAGFISERYTIGIKQGWEIAKKYIGAKLESNVSSKVRAEHHADVVSNVSLQTVFHEIKYKYLLLPVWISSFKYKGKVYQFVVNGQTGKVGGKTPISPWRVAVAILLGLVVAAAIYYFVSISK